MQESVQNLTQKIQITMHVQLILLSIHWVSSVHQVPLSVHKVSTDKGRIYGWAKGGLLMVKKSVDTRATLDSVGLVVYTLKKNW